jgi:hypothetical protein
MYDRLCVAGRLPDGTRDYIDKDFRLELLKYGELAQVLLIEYIQKNMYI